MGLALLISTVLYAIPQTSILGAILVTGYPGVQSPATCALARLSSHGVRFQFMRACWCGWLYMRDERVRAVVPVRR